MREKRDKINKGLSLLELTVVVIIIGVLAGLALPRYQKVVFKSKVTAQAFPKLKRIVDAERNYDLRYNSYLAITQGNTSSAAWDALGMDVPHDANYNYGYDAVGGATGVTTYLGSSGAVATAVPSDVEVTEAGLSLDGRKAVEYSNGTYEMW